MRLVFFPHLCSVYHSRGTYTPRYVLSRYTDVDVRRTQMTFVHVVNCCTSAGGKVATRLLVGKMHAATYHLSTPCFRFRAEDGARNLQFV